MCSSDLGVSTRKVDDLVAALGEPKITGDRIWLLIDALYGGTGAPPQVAVDWARELTEVG